MTANIKITFSSRIIIDDEEAGYINLINYDKQSFEQLEYKIYEKFRGEGIMSRELPRFLDTCIEKGFTKLIAIVGKDNKASIKILKNNSFEKIKEFENYHSFIRDLDYLGDIRNVIGMLKNKEK